MIGFTKAQELQKAGLKEDAWIPRLDQLLVEIEKRDYFWILNTQRICIAPKSEILNYEGMLSEKIFEGEPEDAAADALLWVLGQAKERQKAVELPPEELRCHWLPGRECHNAQCRVNPAHKHTCKNEYFRHHQEQAK